MDDVTRNKMEAIERCLSNVRKYYDVDTFETEEIQQDAIILNLQRAIQQCIDIAAHIVKEKRLGLPKDSRNVFEMLNEQSLLSDDMRDVMLKMITFRNIAVHEYLRLDIEIVKMVIEKRLDDFKMYLKEIAKIDL